MHSKSTKKNFRMQQHRSFVASMVAKGIAPFSYHGN
jgi:hypothetical protein